MRKLFILTICTLMSSYLFGQQSKSDSLTLEFKKYEITEQEFPLLGKQKVIMGTVIIKKDNKKILTIGAVFIFSSGNSAACSHVVPNTLGLYQIVPTTKGTNAVIRMSKKLIFMGFRFDR